MSAPAIRLHALGEDRLALALAEVGAPHLPRRVLSDHYAVGNAALRRRLGDKIGRLVHALTPHLDPARVRWPGARADVLALDLAFVEHPQRPFELAWVEIQAFTSMLPTFHAVHLAHRRLHATAPDCLPHDPLPPGADWVTHVRGWVAPHPDTVLIEDRPRQRATWPDLAGARHWWRVDVHDWRDLVPRHGHLACPVSGRRYAHVWNRLILADLDPPERRRADAVLGAADRVGWHSHPAWYEGIHKGTLAELPWMRTKPATGSSTARRARADTPTPAGGSPSRWTAIPATGCCSLPRRRSSPSCPARASGSCNGASARCPSDGTRRAANRCSARCAACSACATANRPG
ncbi:hypothetical protein [Fulvimonas yonginensis]|uniref:DUF1853 family protein n=1 Tax=Fulvimonas yonginensis TaxID=1495200 RepID=A0ABU8JF96_9GAMM